MSRTVTITRKGWVGKPVRRIDEEETISLRGLVRRLNAEALAKRIARLTEANAPQEEIDAAQEELLMRAKAGAH